MPGKPAKVAHGLLGQAVRLVGMHPHRGVNLRVRFGQRHRAAAGSQVNTRYHDSCHPRLARTIQHGVAIGVEDRHVKVTVSIDDRL